MKILVSGASGLIGKALCESLLDKEMTVFKLVRKAQDTPNTILWNPYNGDVNLNSLEDFDVFINLAGENISTGRWTPSKKKKIFDSRVLGTQNLCRRIRELKKPPKLLINASAIGYYGNNENDILTENSPRGNSFLSHVCQEWEEATNSINDLGIRIIKLRTGIVLSSKEGALGRMLPIFKMGLGGKLGNGEQYMSWIPIDEVVKIIEFCIFNENLSGPVNAVSEMPVINKEFTKTLGKVLHRPTFFTVPASIIKLIFGEMGEELILRGSRVIPEKLKKVGYSFIYPTLESALRSML